VSRKGPYAAVGTGRPTFSSSSCGMLAGISPLVAYR
jgi:hypothetical protein